MYWMVVTAEPSQDTAHNATEIFDKLVCHVAGRTRSREEEEADSSDGSNGSKRVKRSRMERVVSLGTVLRCVDTRSDCNGSLDDAVGERPPTVHEMTEGQWSSII